MDEKNQKKGVPSHFFAIVSRLKHIRRWGLMRNTLPENLQEHSYMTAILGHALAVIRRDVLGLPADPERVALAALFHDAGEIFTGDLPTPVKYFDASIREAYRNVECAANNKLLSLLTPAMRPAYEPLIFEEQWDSEVRALVHAADKLAAYIKCVEEGSAGNREFLLAERQTLAKLEGMNRPEVLYFLTHYLQSFRLTLDEQE